MTIYNGAANTMSTWISLAALIAGVSPTITFGQLYLITGAPTPQDSRAFDSALFQVGEGGRFKLVADLVPPNVGTNWIAMAYDLRKAVILPRDSQKPVSVIDLDKAAVVKQCVLPQTTEASLIEWLANVPGRGPIFEWDDLGSLDQPSVHGMILDPSVSCEESFPKVAFNDIVYIVAHGTSGVAEVGSAEGTHVAIDKDGKLWAPPHVALACDELPVAMRKDSSFSWIIISNSQALVVGTEGANRDNARALVFRKGDRTWHVMHPPGGGITNLRGFGRFISIVESSTKKAVAEQLAKHRNAISINEEVRLKEESAGRAEWRKTDSRMGPDMEEAFANAHAVYPGRLHLYDVETEHFYTKVTNQGDSEILLVEDDTMYYRVSNRLYSAPITDKGIGTERLLATSESIRDAHWAFIKH